MLNRSLVLLMISFVIFVTLFINNNVIFGSFNTFDNSTPSIQIIDPISGSTIPKNTIIVNGTSYDAESGIQKVEAFAHLYPFNGKQEYELATPLSHGNWSKWSIPISFDTPGVYRILARAQDNADNKEWVDNIINVPFVSRENIHSSNINPGLNDFQNNKSHIAFVEPSFTDAAYSPNAFYDFFYKYDNIPKEKNVTTDLDKLRAPVLEPMWIDPYSSLKSAQNLFEFSSIEPHNNHIILFREYLIEKIPDITLTTIRDQDVHNGYIFNQKGKNAYNILILFHDEYATDIMYNNYKRFVSNGGIIIFLDPNVFYAEVDYNKEKNDITLVKGHDWEFDGKSAKKSVSERWFYDNQKWVGSNFLRSHIEENITYKNNPFNYTHFEENYVSNPMARIILDYQIELPESKAHLGNITVASYDLNFGKGKVIMIGLYGDKLVNNTKFLNFFKKLVLDSIYKINSSRN